MVWEAKFSILMEFYIKYKSQSLIYRCVLVIKMIGSMTGHLLSDTTYTTTPKQLTAQVIADLFHFLNPEISANVCTEMF